MSERDLKSEMEFDATLRLLTQAEVPAGLAERVKARLKTQGNVIAWPEKPNAASNWMRRAAAAAIVCVIGGGSWAIYSGAHFDAGAGAGQKPVVIPSAQGNFGNAGAVRKVDPLTAPVVVNRSQRSESRDQRSGIRDQGVESREQGTGVHAVKKGPGTKQ